MAVVSLARGFDEHRNTSRVFAVPPGAAAESRKASERWARENPAHLQWLLDGHPTLTEAEHVERFGVPYDSSRSERR